MILSNFIQRVNYRLRGLEDDAPASGTDEHTYWVDTLNTKIEELYQDVSKLWEETYEVLDLGTVTASTEPSYDLDDTFLAPATSAYVIDSEDRRHDFELIKPQERNPLYQQIFVAGQDPQTVYFSNEVKSTDAIVGGTLYLPAYVMPDAITGTNDNAYIPVPDPNWAVYAVAAEIASSDLTYESKEANLQGKANNLYQLMTKKNRRGAHGSPRKTPYNITPIGQRHRR